MFDNSLKIIEKTGRTMSNDTHVTDVGRLVHKGPDLVCIVTIVSTTQASMALQEVAYEPTVKLLASKKAHEHRETISTRGDRVLTPWRLAFTGEKNRRWRGDTPRILSEIEGRGRS